MGHTAMQQVAGHKVRILDRLIGQGQPNHCREVPSNGFLSVSASSTCLIPRSRGIYSLTSAMRRDRVSS